MTDLTRRERLAIPRVTMPEQPAEERRWNFEEVNQGLDEEMAVREAQRCLECKRLTCVEGCPVGIRIDEFIAHVADGQFEAAAEVISRDNLLPSICGRVCPQEAQCEGSCVLGRKGDPVAIGYLERFVADRARANATAAVADPPAPTGKRVAVVGSGPAGLACAADLARSGHEVTVFEALHALGGVLVYGIPEFRLPKDIVADEIRGLESLGVRFETNSVIGLIDTVDELLGAEGFDAVFIGTGAGLPRFLGIPGENLVGVYSANEFLTRVNLMKAYAPEAETPVPDLLGARVGVFGGGNTAMDAVRTALRLGAGWAGIMYRRSEAEMPARGEEVHHAKDEGVLFETLISPVEFMGIDGHLTGVRLQRMELGEPDESGRRRPVAVPDSEYEIPLDLAVVAIGNAPNPIIQQTTSDLDHTEWGTMVAGEDGKTSKRGVFAGGDIVTGGATVILAMGSGRKAATAIDAYLTTGDW